MEIVDAKYFKMAVANRSAGEETVHDSDIPDPNTNIHEFLQEDVHRIIFHSQVANGTSEEYGSLLKTSTHDWADLLLLEISVLLCFLLVKELLLYMYLSQLMSTFTKLSKGALSSRWFLHPVIQGTRDPTITHVFTYTLVCQIRIHMGNHIPVIFSPYLLLSSNMGLSKCESTYLI